MKLLGLSVFLPGWALPWVVVAAVAAFIIGARRLGIALAILLVMDQVAAPLLAPVLAELPWWVLALVTLVVVLLVVHGLIAAVFGAEAAGHFTGTWLVRITDLLIIGPFRAIRYLLRILGG